MGFLNKVKTTLFGDLNDGQAHGVRAGFVPSITPSLVAAGAVAMGAPVADVGALTALAALAAGAVGVVGVVVGAVGAVGAAGVVGVTGVVCVAGVVGVAALAALTVGAVGAVGAGAAVAGGAAGASVAALADAFLARVYNFKRYLAGAGAGCACGATLVFNVAAAHLPPEQPRAPVAGPVPSTVKSDKGRCGRDFNPAVITDDPLGQKIYMIAAQVNCLSQPNP